MAHVIFQTIREILTRGCRHAIGKRDILDVQAVNNGSDAAATSGPASRNIEKAREGGWGGVLGDLEQKRNCLLHFGRVATN